MPGTVTTPRQLIDWGARLFEEGGLVFQHGTDNALDESAALVMHVLGIGYDQPDSVLDAEMTPADRERVCALLRQRVSTRKPAAYLINTAWFAGLPFYIDERVLVPRSPVAELIEAQFSPWIDPDSVGGLLDLCAGSGCIGIASAYAFPHARVTCSDLSTDALAVARENIRRHGLEQRVSLCESDLFVGLGAQRYDIIVSNPPYVPLGEFAELADEFRHEPSLGLTAGVDGLDVVVKILQHASRHLNAKGILVVEVGHTRGLLIERYPGIPFTWLELENGGHGVFLLDYNQLVEHQHEFDAVASTRGGSAWDGGNETA